jgi:hypothetical protein
MRREDLSVRVTKSSFNARLIQQLADNAQTEVAVLFQLIDNVMDLCSNENIKACRRALTKWIAQDWLAFELLVAFLSAITASISKPRRKRLYGLYLIHDIVYHLRPAWQISPLSIFSMYACAWECQSNRPRLDELVSLWKSGGYFLNLGELAVFADEIRLQEACKRDPTTLFTDRLKQKGFSFGSENLLGSSGKPFYEQPAATMLPHIDRHSGLDPIDSSNIAPLPVVKPSLEVRQALERFYEGVKNWHESKFREQDEDSMWTYDGWTLEFHEMRRDIATTSAEITRVSDSQTGPMQYFTEDGKRFNAFRPFY